MLQITCFLLKQCWNEAQNAHFSLVGLEMGKRLKNTDFYPTKFSLDF